MTSLSDALSLLVEEEEFEAISTQVADADVGGVLVPDAGVEVSVSSVLEIVPAIPLPLTKKP